MKLYTYQKELLNSDNNKVLMNWARGAGTNTALAYYILENKPNNVLLYGMKHQYKTLIKYIESLQEEFSFEIDSKNLEDFTITFTQTDKKVEIIINDEIRGNLKYDLVINTDDFFKVEEDKYNKYILVTTRNAHDLKGYEDYQIINVDHRVMIKENINFLDTIINAARNNKRFFSEYAILDKPKNEDLSFIEFKYKALQKLQKQFLSIDNTKDTVLTRKNIIEMIKDLDQMGKWNKYFK